MKKQLILIVIITLLTAGLLYAVDSTKPSTHTSTWERQHGQAARTNMSECLSCHEERSECIACHEDMSPRNHTVTFVNKTHGLESRWNRRSCQVCHKQDFCESCHETAYPMSHIKAGFNDVNSYSFHCRTCQLPSGSWSNTLSQDCIVCHRTRPMLNTGIMHP